MTQTWQNLTSDGGVRWLKYSFSSWGTANTLAIRLDEGSWLVVSPSSSPSPETFDVLAKDGGVSALLAPNGYHYLGQKAWRERFPKAVSYAADGARSRLATKSPGINFESLDSLKSKLPSRIGIHLPEGMKVPDLMLHATSGGKTVWFSGDVLSNIGPEDLALPMRLVMSLFGGATGYRFNRAPSMVYVGDRSTWKLSVLSAIERAAPSAILPAHGNPVVDNPVADTRKILG